MRPCQGVLLGSVLAVALISCSHRLQNQAAVQPAAQSGDGIQIKLPLPWIKWAHRCPSCPWLWPAGEPAYRMRRWNSDDSTYSLLVSDGPESRLAIARATSGSGRTSVAEGDILSMDDAGWDEASFESKVDALIHPAEVLGVRSLDHVPVSAKVLDTGMCVLFYTGCFSYIASLIEWRDVHGDLVARVQVPMSHHVQPDEVSLPSWCMYTELLWIDAEGRVVTIERRLGEHWPGRVIGWAPNSVADERFIILSGADVLSSAQSVLGIGTAVEQLSARTVIEAMQEHDLSLQHTTVDAMESR